MKHQNAAFFAAIGITGVLLSAGCKSDTGAAPTEAQRQEVRQKNLQNVESNPNIPPEQKERIKALMNANHGTPPKGATTSGK